MSADAFTPIPMGRQLQHPVPGNLLLHIGDVVVSFALLESCIQHLVGCVIGGYQRTGQIVTAELSFKNLRALLISLYLDRHGEDDDFANLRSLMSRSEQAEATRNQIVHSVWVAGSTASTITRFKTTAKEKRGIHFHFEEVDEARLAGFATELKVLAADVQATMINLLHGRKWA